MLTRKQLVSAIAYNKTQFRTSRDLPWAWATVEPGSDTFAWITVVYQMESGLKPDGKLGPKTAAAAKATFGKPIKEDPLKIEVPAGEYSNCIIVNGERVKLPQSFIDAGITASNYLDDGEPHFRHRRRTGPPIHFVLHETCGNTASGCKKSLLRKGYGVQLIMDHKGHLSCHGDLVLDHMTHANQCNKTSFGIEVVNPYSPLYARSGGPFQKFIPASWWTWVPSIKMAGVKDLLKKKGWKKVPREYVSLTDEQIAVGRKLVHWLCHVSGVPYRFPTKGLNRRNPRIDGWNIKPKARPGAGVVAHRDFSTHADARWMLEDLIAQQNK